VFERYTEQARRAIFFARYEASLQGANQITTGLILLGTIREGESRSVAVRILREDESNLRSGLGYPSGNGKPLNDLMTDMPLDEDSKKALACSIEEAESDDSFYVGTDHILRGILRFSNQASDALQIVPLDLAKAREASKLSRTKYHSKKTFYHRLFGNPFQEHGPALLKLLAFVVALFLGALVIHLLN
jgi:ATP-dependent Clp protease ATP-binding subunit ClpC